MWRVLGASVENNCNFFMVRAGFYHIFENGGVVILPPMIVGIVTIATDLMVRKEALFFVWSQLMM